MRGGATCQHSANSHTHRRSGVASGSTAHRNAIGTRRPGSRARYRPSSGSAGDSSGPLVSDRSSAGQCDAGGHIGRPSFGPVVFGDPRSRASRSLRPRDRSAGSRHPTTSAIAAHAARARALSARARSCRHRPSLHTWRSALRFDSVDAPDPDPRRTHSRWPCCWRLEPSPISSWACTAAAGDTPVFRSSSGSQLPWCSGRSSASLVFYGAFDVSGVLAGGSFPRSFWAAEALLSATIIGGVRFGIRAAYHHTNGFRQLARQGQRNPAVWRRTSRRRCCPLGRRDPGAGFRPVGFLDDDPGLAGQIVAGITVFGGLEPPWSMLRPDRRALTRSSSRCPMPPGRAVRQVVRGRARAQP